MKQTPEESKAVRELTDVETENVNGGVNIIGKYYYCRFCAEKFDSLGETLMHETVCSKKPTFRTIGR